MEDYQAAFIERHFDTKTLDQSGRKVAAMHFGGVTIECQLKAIICNTIPGGASQTLRTHSCKELLKKHPKLNSRATPKVREWLCEVENPNSQLFINMRYCGIEPNDASYKRWLYAYKCLTGWLQTEATKL
ncbi:MULTISPECIES: hypothetical protein [unclassified Microcoleus]|uniref:hypothetical protein n=1 Tax=unclassified Microcoleus TaxID=2642155 RepID=UPI002FD53D37